MHQIVTGRGEDAKCELCDMVMGNMMEAAEIEEIECDNLCPFKLEKCLNVCNKVSAALKDSAGYPCIAAKMCPALPEHDEFGDLPR